MSASSWDETRECCRGVRYIPSQKNSQMKPIAPVTMKADCQPNFPAIQGTHKGTTTAPMLAHELKVVAKKSSAQTFQRKCERVGRARTGLMEATIILLWPTLRRSFTPRPGGCHCCGSRLSWFRFRSRQRPRVEAGHPRYSIRLRRR